MFKGIKNSWLVFRNFTLKVLVLLNHNQVDMVVGQRSGCSLQSEVRVQLDYLLLTRVKQALTYLWREVEMFEIFLCSQGIHLEIKYLYLLM